MWYARLSLCALVYLWLPTCYAEDDIQEKIKEDTKALLGIMIAKIQEHPIEASAVDSGAQSLDFIPEELSPISIQFTHEGLIIFELAFSMLSEQEEEQLYNDLVNLRDLIGSLGELSGCSTDHSVNPDNIEKLAEEQAKSAFTVENVAYSKLLKFLSSIMEHLDSIVSC